MRRVDRQRREHRVDPLPEQLLELRLLVRHQLLPAQDLDALPPASAGCSSSAKQRACRVRQVAGQCPGRSPGSRRRQRPMAFSTGRPVAIRRIRPATRTLKNSSMPLAKIDSNRTRSSSGTFGSSASSRTRWLNRSQLSSRSRYRSAGSLTRPASRAGRSCLARLCRSRAAALARPAPPPAGACAPARGPPRARAPPLAARSAGVGATGGRRIPCPYCPRKPLRKRAEVPYRHCSPGISAARQPAEPLPSYPGNQQTASAPRSTPDTARAPAALPGSPGDQAMTPFTPRTGLRRNGACHADRHSCR